MNPIDLDTKLNSMISRGVIREDNDSTKLQSLNVEITKGSNVPDIELMEPYGFSSRPGKGAECIILGVGGSRDQAIAISANNRSHKIVDKEDGEVVVYHHAGHKIHLKQDGSIVIVPSGAGRIILGEENANKPVSRVGDDIGPTPALTTLLAQAIQAMTVLAPLMNAALGTPVLATGPGTFPVPALVPPVIIGTPITGAPKVHA